MKTVKKMQMGGTMMSDSTMKRDSMMKKGGAVKAKKQAATAIAMKAAGKKPKMAMGGAMKDVPAGKKGLAKLPTEVRNKMGYKKYGGGTGKAQVGTEIRIAQQKKNKENLNRKPDEYFPTDNKSKTQMDGKMGMNTYSAPRITKDTTTAPPMKSKGGAIKYGMGGAAPKKKMGGSAFKDSMGGSMKYGMGGSMKYGMGGAMKAKMGGATKTKKK